MIKGPYWCVDGYWLRFVLIDDNFTAEIAKAEKEANLDNCSWEPEKEGIIKFHVELAKGDTIKIAKVEEKKEGEANLDNCSSEPEKEGINKFDVELAKGDTVAQAYAASFLLLGGQLFYTQWEAAKNPQPNMPFQSFVFSKEKDEAMPIVVNGRGGFNPFVINNHPKLAKELTAEQLPAVPATSTEATTTNAAPVSAEATATTTTASPATSPQNADDNSSSPANVSPADVTAIATTAAKSDATTVTTEASTTAEKDAVPKDDASAINLDALTEDEQLALAIAQSLGDTTPIAATATATQTPKTPAKTEPVKLNQPPKKLFNPKPAPAAPVPAATPAKEPRDAKLQEIIDAIELAQQKYHGWYSYHYVDKLDKDKPFKDYPFANGFFTRFRHGLTGQKNAKLFVVRLKDKEVKTPAQAIEILKNHFAKSSTRFNNHSFATFMMMELKKLDIADLGDFATEEHFATFTPPTMS